MKTSWPLALAIALIIVGCAPDRTLDTLIPKASLAVVLVDNPAVASGALGPLAGDFPWKALDQGRPWALAVVQAQPPGLLMVLALASPADSWAQVETWAKSRGGLQASLRGSYAVLASPGISVPPALPPDGQFDLARVRAGGDPVELYVDVANLLASPALLDGPVSTASIPPWVKDNLAGLRLGLNGKAGGLEVRLATDWKPGSKVAAEWARTGTPADLASWSGLLPTGDGFGLVASLPAGFLDRLGTLSGPAGLGPRWSALGSLLGPRVAVVVKPRADGTMAWSAAVEAKDPQGVRQALRTLVAGGDWQHNFAALALDPDTPLIYRDRPDGQGGVLAQVTFGATTFQVGYGPDRVTLAGGADAEAVVRAWRGGSTVTAPWFSEVPSGASLVASGAQDGLGARGSVAGLADGNWELRIWVDAPGVKAWEGRLTQLAGGLMKPSP